MTPIGRSSTGMYHHIAGASSACNGRSFRGQSVGAEMVSKAPEDMFCKKCFSLNKRDITRKGNALFIIAAEAKRKA